MRLRLLAPAPVILISAIFALASARTSFVAQSDVVRASEDRSLRRVSTILDHVTQTEARRATALAEVMAVRKSLQADMRHADRAALLADMQGTWDRLTAAYGIEGIHFIASPGVSFLRVHAPERFGDDLTGRQMIVRAINGGEAQQGVEIGTSGAKVRGVVQMRDADGVLGAVEVQVGFTPVIESVKAMTGYEVAAYVKQEGDPPPDARMVDGYRELVTTNRDAILGVITPELMDGVNDVLTSRRDVDGERFGLARMPMVDFEGNQVGVIVATRSFVDFQKQEQDAFRHALVLAIVQIIAVSGAALLAFNGLVIRPMQRLADQLAAGEGVDPKLAARNDEIGDLARAARKGAE